MPTNCGDLWWLCGPVYNMTSPFYWIGSAFSATLFYWLGYRAGKADTRKEVDE